ncbi:MAG: hypothetical protein GX621_00325 [Pirellulaceae bacterium]|nr:hypothetical protein [Pirellulaceae bacterium]
MFAKPVSILAACFVLVCATQVHGQFSSRDRSGGWQPGGWPPGGGMGPPGMDMRGRSPRGDRSGGGQSDRGGRGDRGDRGGRDRGDRGGGDRGSSGFGRMEGFLRSMDRNGDGVIQESEIPEERRPMFRMMSQRMGLDPDKGVSIQGVRSAVESRMREQGQRPPGEGGAPWQMTPPPKEEPLVPGFGDDQSSQMAAAFGVRLEPTSGLRFSPEKKLDPQVEAAMRWFDRNQSGVLEREEWRRLPGNPEEIDQNRDGRITGDEFAAFMAQRQRRRGQDNDSRDDRGEEEEEPSVVTSFVSRGEGSYRFRSAHERLPSGLPGWFGERDANRDGQVSMAEYSRTWSDSTVKEFARYDRNNDGVVTAEEALNPLGGRSGGSKATDAPAEKAGSPSGGSEKDGSTGAAPSSEGSTPWWMQ